MGFGSKETSENSNSLTHHITTAPMEGMGLPYETQCWKRLQITIGCFTSEEIGVHPCLCHTLTAVLGKSLKLTVHSYPLHLLWEQSLCVSDPCVSHAWAVCVCCCNWSRLERHSGKQSLKGSWNGPLKVKDTSVLDLIAPLFLNCKILTVTMLFTKGMRHNTLTNANEAVRPCCCEHWEGSFGEKFRLRKKILVMYDRLDLLAEQQRKNTVSRNSAQSLLCTDMTKNSTCYQ